jgi:hypothetical protein
MATRGDQEINDDALAADFPWKGLEPDFQYPLPDRPEIHKHDCLELIRLVIAYRASWEIYVLDDGLWAAQGRTPSNSWARFEADTACHLENLMKAV